MNRITETEQKHSFELPAFYKEILSSFDLYCLYQYKGKDLDIKNRNLLFEKLSRDYQAWQLLQYLDEPNTENTFVFGSLGDDSRLYFNLSDGSVWDYWLDDKSTHKIANSFDELLSEEAVKPRYPYESIVEYDIDEIKHFDIKLGSVNHVKMRAGEGEKIKVQLVSDTIENLTELVKVKIDDIKRRIDVDVNRSKSLSEELVKEAIKAKEEAAKKRVEDDVKALTEGLGQVLAYASKLDNPHQKEIARLVKETNDKVKILLASAESAEVERVQEEDEKAKREAILAQIREANPALGI